MKEWGSDPAQKPSLLLRLEAVLVGVCVVAAYGVGGIAKAKGAYNGRKPSAPVDEIKRLKTEGIGVSLIAKELVIACSSVYDALKVTRGGAVSCGFRGLLCQQYTLPVFCFFHSAQPSLSQPSLLRRSR